MGEAARRRRLGLDGKTLLDAALAALNAAAGAPVWQPSRSRDDPRFAYFVDADGVWRGAMALDDQLLQRPYRLVVQSLVRDGRPWMSATVVDRCPRYDRDLYDREGVTAAELAESVMNGITIERVVSATVHTDWPRDDVAARRAGEIILQPERESIR